MNALIVLGNKIENKCKEHYYITYTCVFLIAILFVFSCFWFSGRSFVWLNDGWWQHSKAMIYYARWLRGIVKELVFTHTLNLPAYSFSIGYGSDIITTLHHYVIGDPLLLFSILVPTKYMTVFYSIMVVLRFYLAGITFSMFCFYMGKKLQPSSGFGKTAILAGTLVYIFSGFTLWGGIRHPNFFNPVIYFPLVLLGVEEILDNKKSTLFIVSVFISAISNFYFFYMISILTALYILCRLPNIYSRQQFSEGCKMIVKIILSAILGAGMSAVVLIPEILVFLNSSRSASSGYVYNFFYNSSHYADYIGAFLSVHELPNWTLMGYAAIALISVILLFAQRSYKEVKIVFSVLTLMTLLPMAGSIMNGFSYVSNRWIWGYSFIVAYIVVLKWKSLFCLSAKEKSVLLVSLSAYFIMCVILKKASTVSALFGCSAGFITLGIIYLTKDIEIYGKRCVQFIMLACIIVNIAGNAFFKYSPDHAGYAKEYLTYAEMRNKFTNTEASVIGTVAKKSDEFFRYSGTSITHNGTLLSGLHSTQYDWNIENGNITKFRNEMGLSDQITVYRYTNLDSRTILSALANVKYYVQPSNAPYGFEIVNLKNKNKNYRLWNNNYFLPFGYTYSKYIPEDSYKYMSPIEKQEALLQGCVVSKGQGEKAQVTFSGQHVDYNMDTGENITVDNNIIVVKKNDAVLTLKFDGLPNSETYLYIRNFDFIGNPPEIERQIWISEYKNNKYSFYRKYYNGPARIWLTMSAKNEVGENIIKKQEYFTPRYRDYSNKENFMVNFGYSKDSKKSITITFPRAGIYVFDSPQILCQPMINYPKQIEALKEDVLHNTNFHDKNAAFATNRVTGDISLREAKYLLLTIPYSDGWTAYVDDKRQDIIKANTMWTALYLDKGEHNITLEYRTPGLKVGVIITGISFLIFLAFLYIEKRKSQKGYLC